MKEVITSAWLAEESLLSSDVRHDRDRLLELLGPDFYEIGQSGRRWNRDEIVADSASSGDSASTIDISQREATILGPHAVLLSYLLKFDRRTSRRTSVWLLNGKTLQCVFHQGTPVAAN